MLRGRRSCVSEALVDRTEVCFEFGAYLCVGLMTCSMVIGRRVGGGVMWGNDG